MPIMLMCMMGMLCEPGHRDALGKSLHVFSQSLEIAVSAEDPDG
jgi:hypothetical protein